MIVNLGGAYYVPVTNISGDRVYYADSMTGKTESMKVKDFLGKAQECVAFKIPDDETVASQIQNDKNAAEYNQEEQEVFPFSF